MRCVCEWCGGVFDGSRGRMYCSKACASRASVDRCGGSENARLYREQELDNAARRQERLAMKKRLRERDAAYAEAYPLLASGSVRGQRFIGTFGKREQPTPVDISTHVGVAVYSEASKKEVARQKKNRKGVEKI